MCTNFSSPASTCPETSGMVAVPASCRLLVIPCFRLWVEFPRRPTLGAARGGGAAIFSRGPSVGPGSRPGGSIAGGWEAPPAGPPSPSSPPGPSPPGPGSSPRATWRVTPLSAASALPRPSPAPESPQTTFICSFINLSSSFSASFSALIWTFSSCRRFAFCNTRSSTAARSCFTLESFPEKSWLAVFSGTLPSIASKPSPVTLDWK
mmetsp:Transcript_31151/g.74050  ORF Transcript_31151/g.74050 Transcript_31151/m.74050 type:complete len:207 (+) Transcript_31151:614-1234(+)